MANLDPKIDLSKVSGRIIAHRGLHSGGPKPNSLMSFEYAAREGFGIELDVRDYNSELIVAHDPPKIRETGLKETLDTLLDLDFDGILSINIKSDGLLPELEKLQGQLSQLNHYFFDMSVPQLIAYRRSGLSVATRISDCEVESSTLLSNSADERLIWLDGFFSDWWIGPPLIELLDKGLGVHVVSPELHKRDETRAWAFLRELFFLYPNLGVCTDKPREFLSQLS